MHIKQLLITISLILSISPVFAVNIVECEDESGNITFQDRCPPGSRQVNEKNYSTTVPAGENIVKAQLTLYLVPNCDTCNQLKEFLQIRDLQFSEKDVSNDINLQNELKDVAGELQVPALVIGDEVLTGYNRSALIQSLSASGHITE